jgi:hypothetical protein
MYESRGRQYLVITAVQGGAVPGVPGTNPSQELPPGTPIGHIAFALPR